MSKRFWGLTAAAVFLSVSLSGSSYAYVAAGSDIDPVPGGMYASPDDTIAISSESIDQHEAIAILNSTVYKISSGDIGGYYLSGDTLVVVTLDNSPDAG